MVDRNEEVRKISLTEHKTAHRWHPNQLRHTRAAETQNQFGPGSASSMLGHSQLSTAPIFAKQDAERAMSVARAIA